MKKYTTNDIEGLVLEDFSSKKTTDQYENIHVCAFYTFLKAKDPKSADYCSTYSKKIIDISKYADVLKKLYDECESRETDSYAASFIGYSYTAKKSLVSDKLSFFVANSVNAANEITVQLRPKTDESSKLIADRGINYVKPPTHFISKVDTTNGSYYAPVYQGLINTNFVQYDKEAIVDSLGVKKLLQHLVLMTEMRDGMFVPRGSAFSVYGKFSSLGVFTPDAEKNVKGICDELKELAGKFEIAVEKESLKGYKYGDFLSKMYDNIYEKKGMAPYSKLLNHFNATFKKSVQNIDDKKVLSSVLVIACPNTLDENGEAGTSNTIEYVSPIMPKLLTKNADFNNGAPDYASAAKVLQASRKWGGEDDREYNLGQRDAMLGAWVGSEAGDVVRLAGNMGMYKDNQFNMVGTNLDLVRLCRALTHLDECAEIKHNGMKEKKSEYIHQQYTIYCEDKLVRNKSFLSRGDNFYFALNSNISVCTYTDFATLGNKLEGMTRLNFLRYESVAAVEQSRVATRIVTESGTLKKFIRRFPATPAVLQALFTYNVGKKDDAKLRIFSGVELHNLVLWVSKGIAIDESYAGTHYEVDDNETAQELYKASVMYNQFRMFNTFWNVPVTVLQRKYKIKIPYIPLEAPLRFTTLQTLTTLGMEDDVVMYSFNIDSLKAAANAASQYRSGESDENDPGDDDVSDGEDEEASTDWDTVDPLPVAVRKKK